METIVLFLVSLPARKLMLQRFLRPLISNFGSQTFDFYFRLSTFNFLVSGFEFLIYDHISDLILDIRFRVRSFTSDHWRKIFWLPASDFQFTTSDIRFRSSEFGVYFEPLTYNFLTTDFGILIHNFRLLSLHFPRLSLWTFRNDFEGTVISLDCNKCEQRFHFECKLKLAERTF